jgi:hypothetical protein
MLICILTTMVTTCGLPYEQHANIRLGVSGNVSLCPNGFEIICTRNSCFMFVTCISCVCKETCFAPPKEGERNMSPFMMLKTHWSNQTFLGFSGDAVGRLHGCTCCGTVPALAALPCRLRAIPGGAVWITSFDSSEFLL